MAIYLIILGAAPLWRDLTSQQSRAAALIGVGASVALLALTLFESGRNFGVRAERLQTCGRELGDLERKLEFAVQRHAGSDLLDEVEKLDNEYTRILSACCENHEPADFEEFKVQNAEHFKVPLLSKWAVRTKRSVTVVGPYVTMILLPPLVAWLSGWL